MIEIGCLRLQLPQGFETRAPRIVRLVGEHLARESISASRDLTHLQIGPLTLHPGMTDHQTAGRIARAISKQLPGDN